ncbi:MAG: hypothetical protein OS112_10420 [Methanoregula sp.]|nr:MAG: hypothetical protein OS112_10420 [Methanoregula sp.]
MVEERQSPGPVLPIQVVNPIGNPATPVTVNTARSKKRWIVIAGILVLIVIIVVALLAFGILSTSDPIVGTWTVESTGLQMQFDTNGMATLRYPDTGYYAIGRWERVAENRYQLYSAKGTKSPLLSYDPIADALHTDDFSIIFVKKG